MSAARHRPNRGALGDRQVWHSLCRVQAPENPGGLRVTGRSMEGLEHPGGHALVTGATPLPSWALVLFLADLRHGRELAPRQQDTGQAAGGFDPAPWRGVESSGDARSVTPGWVKPYPHRFTDNQPARRPHAQASGEPERVAGSPKDLGVCGGMLPLAKPARRAGRPSRPGVCRPREAFALRGAFVFRPGPSVIPGQTATGCSNETARHAFMGAAFRLLTPLENCSAFLGLSGGVGS